MNQGSPEWLAARVGKFTASRIADLMARTKSGPAASRANLLAQLAVERITGQPEDGYKNPAMERGTDLEPFARAAYEARHGLLVEEVGFVAHPTISALGASPDGLVGDDGLVELKCPSAMGKHLSALRSGAHATEYRWQVQCQMAVTGRQWCDVTSFDPRWPDRLQLAIKRVQRDDAAIAEMLAAVEQAEQELTAIVAELMEMQK